MEWKTGLKTFRESLLPARESMHFNQLTLHASLYYWEILSVRDLLGAPTMSAILRVVCESTSGCRYSSWSWDPSVGQSKRTHTDDTESISRLDALLPATISPTDPGIIVIVQKPGLRCVSPGMYVLCCAVLCCAVLCVADGYIPPIEI
jgi:hypothetical protein